MDLRKNRTNTETFLLAELKADGTKVLVEKNSFIPYYAASVSKVFLGGEFIRLLAQKKIRNKEVKIMKKDLAGYGTDVLTDLVKDKNTIRIDAFTIVGLMLKYSCNSSAFILAKYFLPDWKTLDRTAKEVWGLKNSKLTTKNGRKYNYFSLQDFLIIFQRIYSEKGKLWGFIRSKLKTSRNIYYLFDQQELNLLGTKSGTKKIRGNYLINDCGVFRFEKKTYFMGAMVSNKSISKGVFRIRKISRLLMQTLKR